MYSYRYKYNHFMIVNFFITNNSDKSLKKVNSIGVLDQAIKCLSTKSEINADDLKFFNKNCNKSYKNFSPKMNILNKLKLKTMLLKIYTSSDNDFPIQIQLYIGNKINHKISLSI